MPVNRIYLNSIKIKAVLIYSFMVNFSNDIILINITVFRSS